MCAVPNMAVFCSSLTSCFPGMLLPSSKRVAPSRPPNVQNKAMYLYGVMTYGGCHVVKVMMVMIMIILILLIIIIIMIMKSRNYRKQPYWALHTHTAGSTDVKVQ